MAQDESRKTHTVRVATYNIHRARGLDGRTRLERIAAVLATIDADIVALQEVVGCHRRSSPARRPNSVRRSAWAG